MNEQSIKDAIQNGSAFGSYSSDSSVENVIRWKIYDAMTLRGQGREESAMQTICRKVASVILRDYPNLTDNEFEIILEAGISGELGKDTWVSGASILQWMRVYSNHPTRIAIIDEKEEERNDSHRLTRSEVEELNEKACKEKAKSAFEYYKEHGTIYSGSDPRGLHLPQFASIIYHRLKDEGYIKEPDANRTAEAEAYADRKVAEKMTAKEFIPSAREDWMGSYLLEQYFKDICNGKV